MSMPQPPTPSSSHGKAPILECVREGFGFLARDWRAIAPVALIGAVVLTPVNLWSEGAQARHDLGGMLAAGLAAGLLQTPVLAAYFRRAASRGATPLALKLGADELNLASVTLAVTFLFLILALVALFVLGFALAALASRAGIDMNALQAMDPAEAQKRIVAAIGRDGQLFVVGMVVACAAVFLWFSARLALSYPATVAEGRMQVFSTWRWTKGNATSVAACLLLVAIGAVALYMLAMAPFALLIRAVFGEAALTMPANPGYWILSYLSSAAVLALVHAPYAAMLAYLYRGLRPA